MWTRIEQIEQIEVSIRPGIQDPRLSGGLVDSILDPTATGRSGIQGSLYDSHNLESWRLKFHPFRSCGVVHSCQKDGGVFLENEHAGV